LRGLRDQLWKKNDNSGGGERKVERETTYGRQDVFLGAWEKARYPEAGRGGSGQRRRKILDMKHSHRRERGKCNDDLYSFLREEDTSTKILPIEGEAWAGKGRAAGLWQRRGRNRLRDGKSKVACSLQRDGEERGKSLGK